MSIIVFEAFEGRTNGSGAQHGVLFTDIERAIACCEKWASAGSFAKVNSETAYLNLRWVDTGSFKFYEVRRRTVL